MGLVQKSFSDIITFSRSSNATRVGPTGVLEYAPHNLLTYSEQFDNAAWNKVNTTVTSNAIAAPNGTVTADLVTANTSSNFGFLYSSNTASGVFTASVYAKQGTQRYIQLLSTATVAYWANFDLQDGLAYAGGTTSSVSIVSVGNGWYRCSVNVTDSSSNTFTVGFVTALNSARAPSTTLTTNCYLWGAQLAVGPYALDYVPTTSAAVYGPRFDYDGSGVTIVEPVSRNLLLYSEQFNNASWSKSNASITANAIAAPDGTVTADKLVEAATTSVHSATQTVTFAANLIYTTSVYAKAGERSFLIIQPTGDSRFAYYNLSNGTVGTVSGSPLSTQIQSVGNNWYRCTITVTSPGATAANCILYSAATDGNATYTGDGSSGIYLWGAQVEVGSTATAYMVSGATNGFRAVPVVSGSATPRGLLVEEQRTNLLTYSEDFSNAAWTKLELNVTANAVAAPDGTIAADFLSETTVNDQHAVYVSFSTTSGTAYSMSFYAKANQRSKISLFLGFGLFTDRFAWFDLATGAVGGVSGSTISAAITSVGNGWYRCSVSATAIATGSAAFGVALQITGTAGAESYAGTAGYGVYLWGAQLESGAFSTSYIPTLASTVTRSADVASVNTLSPWYSATEGTLFAEASRPALGGAAAFACLSTDANNRIQIGNRTGGGATTRLDYWVSTLGVDQAYLTFDNTFAANTPAKIAGAYKADDFAASANGATTKTDSSGSVPAIVSLLLGANTTTPSSILNGHLRRVAFFPRRLSNAELQALTA